MTQDGRCFGTCLLVFFLIISRLQPYIDMKKIFLFIAIAAAAVAMGCKSTTVTNDTRDYAYEAYLDSIWDNDHDYYVDVIEETDEYQEYIEKHGEWWEE